MTVVFADSTWKTLEYLEAMTGKDKAALLRDVISLGTYMKEQTDRGGHIVVQFEDRQVEIALPFDKK